MKGTTQIWNLCCHVKNQKSQHNSCNTCLIQCMFFSPECKKQNKLVNLVIGWVEGSQKMSKWHSLHWSTSSAVSSLSLSLFEKDVSMQPWHSIPVKHISNRSDDVVCKQLFSCFALFLLSLMCCNLDSLIWLEIGQNYEVGLPRWASANYAPDTYRLLLLLCLFSVANCWAAMIGSPHLGSFEEGNLRTDSINISNKV